MKLEDGRIIATEDEEFMIGSKVFSVGDDGEAEPLSSGAHTLSNGNIMKVSDGSKIEDLGEEAESVEEEDLAEDDGKEADVDDWAGMEKRIQNLEDAVADLKGDKVEASVEEKTEMSSDVISELMTQIEDLTNKVVELSEAPAEDGITYNPEGNIEVTKTSLEKMSSQDRAVYYINSLKNN